MTVLLCFVSPGRDIKVFFSIASGWFADSREAQTLRIALTPLSLVQSVQLNTFPWECLGGEGAGENHQCSEGIGALWALFRLNLHTAVASQNGADPGAFSQFQYLPFPPPVFRLNFGKKACNEK